MSTSYEAFAILKDGKLLPSQDMDSFPDKPSLSASQYDAAEIASNRGGEPTKVRVTVETI